MKGGGHIAVDCPNRKVITLAEQEAVKEHVIEEENEEDVKGARGSRGVGR